MGVSMTMTGRGMDPRDERRHPAVLPIATFASRYRRYEEAWARHHARQGRRRQQPTLRDRYDAMIYAAARAAVRDSLGLYEREDGSLWRADHRWVLTISRSDRDSVAWSGRRVSVMTSGRLGPRAVRAMIVRELSEGPMSVDRGLAQSLAWIVS